MQRSKYVFNNFLFFILIIILILTIISLNFGLVYLDYKLGLLICSSLKISKNLTLSFGLPGFIYIFVIVFYIIENLLLIPFYKLIKVVYKRLISFI